MKNINWTEIVFILVAVVVVPISLGVVSAHFEAKAFNKHTGKNVSMWDALFLQLRIDGDD
jgi:hypothetical protein